MLLQQKQSASTSANDLPHVTLVVIGLWNMGYTDLESVGRLLGMIDLKPLRKLFKMLKSTRNPVIRRCVDHGLPAGVCRPFPPPPGPGTEDWNPRVRCKLCGHMVSWVPCPLCAGKGPRDPEPPESRCGWPVYWARVPHPFPQHFTSAEPGSPEKIAVLRDRVVRHQQLFHPLDKTIPRKVYRESKQGS